MAQKHDPRVFFAAQRTLLAWNRTSLTLMAFGFMIERFGLFVHIMLQHSESALQRGISFWIGIGFISLGAITCIDSVYQYLRVVKKLTKEEFPIDYRPNPLSVISSIAVSILGVVLIGYLVLHNL